MSAQCPHYILLRFSALAAVFDYDNDAFNDVKDIGIFPRVIINGFNALIQVDLSNKYTDLLFYLDLTDLIERY